MVSLTIRSSTDANTYLCGNRITKKTGIYRIGPGILEVDPLQWSREWICNSCRTAFKQNAPLCSGRKPCYIISFKGLLSTVEDPYCCLEKVGILF